MGTPELSAEDRAVLEDLERSWGTHKRVRARRKRRKVRKKPAVWIDGRRVS